MNKLSGHNADVSGIVGLLVFELRIYRLTIKLQLNAELTEKTLPRLKAKTLLRMTSSLLVLHIGGVRMIIIIVITYT